LHALFSRTLLRVGLRIAVCVLVIVLRLLRFAVYGLRWFALPLVCLHSAFLYTRFHTFPRLFPTVCLLYVTFVRCCVLVAAVILLFALYTQFVGLPFSHVTFRSFVPLNVLRLFLGCVSFARSVYPLLIATVFRLGALISVCVYALVRSRYHFG